MKYSLKKLMIQKSQNKTQENYYIKYEFKK